MLLNCGVGEDSWQSLGLQGDQTSPSWRKSVLIIHWKDWCWNWNSNPLATWCKELTHWKRPWCWERVKAGGEGMTEDETAGWHHRLNGHEFEQALGVGDGQGGLVCCDSWRCKESDTTEQLNWTELNWKSLQMVTAAIKRHLPLGRKVMTNLDSILKGRDIHYFAYKGSSSQSYGFSSNDYCCTHVRIWELDYKESWRIDAFELQSWRELVSVPWTQGDPTSQQSKGGQS